MKGIILYKSKYGATKRYAQWLSEETGFEIRENSKVRVSDVKEYDVEYYESKNCRVVTLQKCGEIYAPAFKFYEKNGFKLSQGTVCMFNEIEDQI